MNTERERIRREIFEKNNTGFVEQNDSTNEELEGKSEINPELLRLFPLERIERIKKKELRKYKNAQDKKWRNYLEAVSK